MIVLRAFHFSLFSLVFLTAWWSVATTRKKNTPTDPTSDNWPPNDTFQRSSFFFLLGQNANSAFVSE